MTGGRLATTLLAAAAGFLLGAFVMWAVGGDAPPATGHHDDAAKAAAPAAVPSTRPATAASAPRAGRVAAPVAGAGSDPGRAETTKSQDGRPARAKSPSRDPLEKEVVDAIEKEVVDAVVKAVTSGNDPLTNPPAGITSVVVLPRGGEKVPPLRQASGVVVDAATQQPVASARVLLAIAEGPQAGSWWGATTGDDGSFGAQVGGEVDLTGSRLEVRVSKDGYEPALVPAAEKDMRVELRIRGSPAMPGRVAGTARRADRTPFTGEIEVEGADEHGNNASQIVLADTAGAFVLEGVPPGRWRLRVGAAQFVAVLVPDGGETRVDLAAPKPGEETGFVVTDIDPATVKPTDKVLAARAAALRILLESLAAERSPGLDEGARSRLTRAVVLEFQTLDAQTRAALPRRDVAVTGLGPAAGGLRAWLRLEVKPRLFRRVEIVDGVARFASVPVGPYTAVLVVPGRPDVVRPIVVAPGDGAFDAAWTQ